MRKYNKIIRIFTFLFILFSCQTAYSQQNYLSGYIIRLNGDTIYGYIDYRNWKTNPVQISFENLLDSNEIIYTPFDIKEFGVADEKYKSATVETEVSQIIESKLDENQELNLEYEKVFLQTMFEGSKNLYYYRNRIDKDQFYVFVDSTYFLLKYKKYLGEINGLNVVLENKNYIAALTYYLDNCSEINKLLQATKYNKASMEKLFLLYFDNSESQISFYKKTEKIIVQFGVLAGLAITKIEFKSQYNDIVYANFKNNYNYSAGLYINLVIPRNLKRWSIYNELVLHQTNYYGEYNNYIYLTKYNIKLLYLKISNFARFNYQIGNMKIFINAGLSNGFSLNTINEKKEISHLTSEIKEYSALEYLRTHEQSLAFGTGCFYNRFSFEIRFERGNGISDYRSMSSFTKRLYFLLGFRI